VRVILDECLPAVFANELTGHDVVTVRQAGFAGVRNGELLKRIEKAGFDAFVTVDKNLPNEHRMTGLSFGIVLLRAKSNRLVDIRPLTRKILEALDGLKRGQVTIVARPRR
jgi:predicted nuclease of predicted toxin-antitoxin system